MADDGSLREAGGIGGSALPVEMVVHCCGAGGVCPFREKPGIFISSPITPRGIEFSKPVRVLDVQLIRTDPNDWAITPVEAIDLFEVLTSLFMMSEAYPVDL